MRREKKGLGRVAWTPFLEVAPLSFGVSGCCSVNNIIKNNYFHNEHFFE